MRVKASANPDELNRTLDQMKREFGRKEDELKISAKLLSEQNVSLQNDKNSLQAEQRFVAKQIKEFT